MNASYKHTRLACYLAYTAQCIGTCLPPLLFSTFQSDFGIQLDRISAIITMNFAIQIFVVLFAGQIVDRIGFRPMSILSHILTSTGLIGLGIFPFMFPDPFTGIMVATLIMAVGNGCIESIASPIIAAVPSDHKESEMSLLHSVFCWAQVIVILSATLYFTISGMGHWNYITILLAIIPIVNVVLFMRVPLPEIASEEERAPIKKLFFIKTFWFLMLCIPCAGASELSISQWASLFAEKGLGTSKTVGDLLGPAAFTTLMAVSRTFYGFKGHKIHLEKALLISSVGLVLSYLGTVFLPIPMLSLICVALCGLFVGIMWPGTLSLAAKHFPGGGSGMLSTLAFSGNVGVTFAPVLVGLVSSAAEQQRIPLVASIIPSSSPTELGLKTGILFAALFPAILVLLFTLIKLDDNKKKLSIEKSVA